MKTISTNMVYVLDLKVNFEVQYAIEVREGYKLEKLELRDPIECYHVIQTNMADSVLLLGNPWLFIAPANVSKRTYSKNTRLKSRSFLTMKMNQSCCLIKICSLR